MASETHGNRINTAIWKNETTGAPGVNDDSSANYQIGSIWVRTSTDDVYICEDDSVGAANWLNISAGGAPGIGDLPTGSKGEQYTTNDAETSMEFTLASKWIPVRKGSAGTISAGAPVYISGYNVGGWIEVEEADADDGAKMPAVGLAYEDLTNSSTDRVLMFGRFVDLDTSSWSVGDEVYVSTTAGTLTNTKPTGTAAIQKVAVVGRSNAVNGVLIVFGAGRSNDVPNLASTNLWVGNGSGVATAVAMSGDATMDNAGAVSLNVGTTKGDVIVHNGTNHIRLAVGTDTHVLTADSAQASGVKWAAAGAGGGFVALGFSAAATTVAKGNTDYLGMTGGNASSTEANAEFYIPAQLNGATIQNLYVYVSTNNTGADGNTITVRKNGASTSIVATFDTGVTGSQSDTSNSTTVATGDRLCFQVVNQGSGGGSKDLVIESISLGVS